MSLDIEITSESLPATELRAALTERAAGVRFEVREPVRRYRNGASTAVVVAIVSGGMATFSAVITGIFALLSSRQGGDRTIVIRGSNRSIEFPADLPEEDRVQLVELALHLDDPVIELP
jgi:hypothetical protein